MITFRAYLVFVIILLLGAASYAQPSNNRRCHTLILPYQGAIDSLLIDLNSIQIRDRDGQLVEVEGIEANYAWAKRELSISLPKGYSESQQFQVCYRVFPSDMTQGRQARVMPQTDTASLVDRMATRPIKQALSPPDFIKLEGLGGEELQTSGQLSRGVSVGTGAAQDVGVNSALNLQLEGEIAPGLELSASISDQQVPFQPEGNTQQLQDFDQILLQLRHENGLLQAGDVQFAEDSASYFLQFYKNVQGAQVNIAWQDTLGRKQETQVGIASAKGVFQSQQVTPTEGVQGPYRLRGRNQERFIVVMAGSEKVFVDGKPLERGFDADYTIDYNQAEVTFTNRIVITEFTRIRIDFEYAVQQYSRNIVQAMHREQIGKLDWHIRFYREKDNPNAPLISELGRREREALELAGDSLELAIVPTITEIEYTPNQVLYEQKDTIVNGVQYAIVQRSTAVEATLFSVAFSEVGLGFGNYALVTSTSNGRVYEWVAPIAGIAQGSYEPIRQVPAPNQRQMASTSFQYQLKNGSLYGNAAVSEQDQNLLSEKRDEDNQGWAGRVGYQWEKDSLGKEGNSRLSAFVEAEYDQQYFRPIDRFRSVEFDRDWSVGRTDSNATDRIVKVGVDWTKGKTGRLRYTATRRHREGATDGWQQWSAWNYAKQGWSWKGTGFLMQTQLPSQEATSRWKRLNTSLTKSGKILAVGYVFSLDQNAISSTQNDSIFQTAMYFQAHEGFIHTGDSLQWQARASYNYRIDQRPVQGQMEAYTRAHTANFSLKKEKARNRFELLATYRYLEQLQLEESSTQTLMARLDWDKSLWKRAVQYQLRFSTASGQELRREFVYLPVDVGTGTHNWRDDNEDGIQDLAEFYPAVFPDERRFARFFIPTDEYVQAFATLVNARLQLKAPRHWRKSSVAAMRFLARWSGQGSIAVNKRTTSPSLADRVWVGEGQNDDSLLGYKNQSRWGVFFNRGSTKFSGEYRGNYLDNKQLLTNGTQRSRIFRHELGTRWSWKKVWILKNTFFRATTEQSADALASQNYQVGQWGVMPGLDYQPTPNIRAGIFIDLKVKNGSTPNNELATAQFTTLGLECRSASQKRGTIAALLKASFIDFSGQADTPLGYNMLEALRPGANWQWEASWNHRLVNGLQLTLRYQARKPDGLQVIHNGTVQVAAIF